MAFSLGLSEANGNGKLWVFGYGSLLWNPGFGYVDSAVGYVTGYSRRFWQGNTVHRGTPKNPGRVVTLVKEAKEVTWGRAYEPSDSELATAFSYLNKRECQLGGYETTIVQFHPKNPKRKPFPVLIYVATSGGSECYLGPAPMPKLAQQIVHASGACGSNVEYVVRLADFMREHLPEVKDEHLFALEDHVRSEVKKNNLDFSELMGSDYDATNDKYRRSDEDNANNNNNGHEQSMSLFTERVVPKKLRCVKI